jgi:tetraprenyl-beta-curcumene synthase
MALAGAFASAAYSYWVRVFPISRREIRGLRRQACRIPNPLLRQWALASHSGKWGHIEGASAFAAFAPVRQRATLVRVITALQAVYDYADILMEQPSEQPLENARALHSSLLHALWPETREIDYYAHNTQRDDGGYLASLVGSCRIAVEQLPSFRVVERGVIRHAERIIEYQSYLNLRPESGYDTFKRWASNEETPVNAELRWWEAGAAGGSPLALYALLAGAAKRSTTATDAITVEAIYWPWAGALHTLLDSLIDHQEDARTHQHSLVAHYSTSSETAQRMRKLAREAMLRAASAGHEHHLILGGMIAFYLSDQRAHTAPTQPASDAILKELGSIARPTIGVLRARRLARHRTSQPT